MKYKILEIQKSIKSIVIPRNSNYDIEINEEWYISVKGTSKAYNKKSVDTIKYHIDKWENTNPKFYKKNIIKEKFLQEKLGGNLSAILTYRPDRYWLNLIAFLEIGSMLNDSAKTIPIKIWKSKLVVSEV